MDTTTNAPVDWNAELRDQLEWHWANQLRPRLDGLTDDEYFWEPVAECWNLRPRGESDAPISVGGGAYTIDYGFPEPTPVPVTTIAWRLGHLVVGVFGARNAAHFGGPPMDYESHVYAGTAAEALEQLDQGYARWIEGVRGLGESGLARQCGEVGPFSERTMAALVLHIHREIVHHGAEIALLRDLYLRE
ncbi:DinB family protein [Streptomyces oceani]|uniref:Serine/arginine repetitive matrix protein 1 n=1 Tax=Streptomyces oceani TaxID=1075402 RepID=A0A1E7JX64_9ACTN|nr:DinB family protein [Streptomyces oceani]OEU96198.1 serine/arginine repetitive matrix protein 1 [Streptomyces oceani]